MKKPSAAPPRQTVWRGALDLQQLRPAHPLHRPAWTKDDLYLRESATFAYDALGRMSSSTDRLGRRRDFGYDALGRQTTETWIASNGSTVDNRVTFSYDAVGNKLTAADTDGAYTMTYDALNRTITSHDLWGNRLTMTYDAVGNRTQVEDNFGGVTTTTYSSLNQLSSRLFGGSGQTQARIDQTYTADGRLTTIQRFSAITGAGSEVALTSYSYDNAGRLVNIHHREADTDTIANYTMAYDNHSRITSITRNGTPTTYSYDDTDQVTADGHTTVTYDANGNRNNGSYSVGTGNRLLSHSTWNFSYDDEGNLTKKSKGATQETWTYQYDQRNQLTSVKRSQTDGGAVDLQVDFKYDASGNRTEKSYDADGAGAGSATVTRFALDMWKNTSQHLVGNENVDVWADHTSGGSLTTRYLRGDIVDQLFARQDSGTQYWYLTDHLGSIRDVINNSAVVKDSIQYNAFGEIISETDANFRGRYAWTGREFDTETTLQYNRARHYDAQTARWTSQDPLGFDAGDSNLYRYVRNKATTDGDASGLKVTITLHTVQATGGSGLPVGQHATVVWTTKDGRRAEWDGGGQQSVNPATGRPTPTRSPPKIGTWGSGGMSGGWDVVSSPYSSEDEELMALDGVYANLKQLPYSALGPNSNTYARQLLTLAGFTVKQTYKDEFVDGTDSPPSVILPAHMPKDVYFKDKGLRTIGFLCVVRSIPFGIPSHLVGWSGSYYGGSSFDSWGNEAGGGG